MIIMKLRTIDEESITYNGFFDGKNLYSFVTNFFKDKGYDINELISIADTTNFFKKNNVVDVRPEIKLNDYYKIELKINLIFKGVEDVSVDTPSGKKELQKGMIIVKIEGNINSSYDDKLGFGMFSEIIRTLNDNLFMKKEYDFAQNKLRKDVSQFKHFVSEYLNSNILFKKIS